jgi:hypothetical protein
MKKLMISIVIAVAIATPAMAACDLRTQETIPSCPRAPLTEGGPMRFVPCWDTQFVNDAMTIICKTWPEVNRDRVSSLQMAKNYTASADLAKGVFDALPK